MPPSSAISMEDNLKLLAAFSVSGGDVGKVGDYMGITKNAAGKRYKALMATFKDDMIAKGLITEPEKGKKRAADDEDKAAEPKKKTKAIRGKAKQEIEEDCAASDEAEAGSDWV